MDELHVKQREIFLEQLELTSRWNRSLMITQLPVEILTLIFVYSSRRHPFSDEDNCDYFRVTLAKSRWTKLMLVCRRWCDVVRTTPALWRTIDVGEEKAWLKLSLLRSDNALIDVSFSSESDFDDEHAAILEPHYHRLRSFRLEWWSPPALRVICENLPALESLEVLNTSYDYLTRDSDGIHTMTDLGITQQRFPNLRTLHVAYTPLPTDPSFYSHIRRLSLNERPFNLSLEQFMQLLSDIPGLRYLELDDFLQYLSDDGNVGLPLRSLPSLRFLGLHNHVPRLSTRFLSRIDIPAASLSITANVDGDFDGEENEFVDVTLCDVLPPDLRTSLRPQLTNVTWGRLTTVYDEYTIECHSTIPEPDETTLVKLSLTSYMGRQWDYRQSGGIADLIALFGSAPLTHLETRGYCVSASYVMKRWVRLFRAFPSLVSLEVAADDTVLAGFLEASLASPTDQPVVCRRLERIVLNDEWVSLKGDRMDAIFEPLLRCLVYRAERGARLKELRLEFHREAREAAGEKYLSQLESLVSDVVFGDAWSKNDQHD